MPQETYFLPQIVHCMQMSDLPAYLCIDKIAYGPNQVRIIAELAFHDFRLHCRQREGAFIVHNRMGCLSDSLNYHGFFRDTAADGNAVHIQDGLQCEKEISCKLTEILEYGKGCRISFPYQMEEFNPINGFFSS